MRLFQWPQKENWAEETSIYILKVKEVFMSFISRGRNCYSKPVMSSHFFSIFGTRLAISFIATIMIIPAHSNPIVAVGKVSTQKNNIMHRMFMLFSLRINTYLLIFSKRFILGLSNDIKALYFRVMWKKYVLWTCVLQCTLCHYQL